ncbi:CPBP family intramembrane metalloprotease [Bradyrhizobium sp. KB893862 SZCCT0404]|uniref:CPBP family intramembrane glutamic endopeptidase n=1 Tax=Bradyrhizobium sp. KB893862 SZCCT0404 TaxID=2807672 RepID=UPI001BA70DDC|nr:CPBP family intramembrane glutamic endopeptidase [Bradyrhizobium sp. KB893862 SZCCT0404]MBR1173163.1 CPBP family intramembrane metalloprotease [Bradyrhizobium sp. KB893862 SZCCT0404]
MSDLENAGPSATGATPRPRTWDFAETLLVALLCDLAFMLTGGIAMRYVILNYGGGWALSATELQAVSLQGRWQGTGIILGAPAVILVLWIAIRMARRGFSEYLALNWPSGGEIVRALCLMAIVVSIEMVLMSAVGSGGYKPGPDLIVHSTAGLLAMLIGSCIVAPVIEELVVRGFIFRGWSQSFLGPNGAIVLASALWAFGHVQYDLFERFNVFLMGLALGYLRSSGNSTWLAVIAHSAVNTFVYFSIGPYV